MKKKRIVCFGDSLTWGANPKEIARFDEEDRWPMVLQAELGDDYQVIEEAQPGRTISNDDPAENDKNGIKYIVPCVESHDPFDLLVIMLGTNDCKRKFANSAMDIGGEMRLMIEKVLAFRDFRCISKFKVMIIAPPVISEAIKDSWIGDSFGFENAHKVSSGLAKWYKETADMYGCAFMNADDYVKTSDIDGVHLDPEEQRKLGRAVAEYIKNEIRL